MPSPSVQVQRSASPKYSRVRCGIVSGFCSSSGPSFGRLTCWGPVRRSALTSRSPFPVTVLSLRVCTGEGRWSQTLPCAVSLVLQRTTFAAKERAVRFAVSQRKQEAPESHDKVETSRTDVLRALSACLPVPNRRPSA